MKVVPPTQDHIKEILGGKNGKKKYHCCSTLSVLEKAALQEQGHSLKLMMVSPDRLGMIQG